MPQHRTRLFERLTSSLLTSTEIQPLLTDFAASFQSCSPSNRQTHVSSPSSKICRSESREHASRTRWYRVGFQGDEKIMFSLIDAFCNQACCGTYATVSEMIQSFSASETFSLKSLIASGRDRGHSTWPARRSASPSKPASSNDLPEPANESVTSLYMRMAAYPACHRSAIVRPQGIEVSCQQG